MVQKLGFPLGVWYVVLRVILFCVLVWVAAETSTFALDILKNNLGYQTPESWADINLVDPWISFEFASILWMGIIFGTLGRKFDYILIALAVLAATYDFYGTETRTTAMMFGLFGAIIIGNAIGFGLKLLLQKFLPKLKV